MTESSETDLDPNAKKLLKRLDKLVADELGPEPEQVALLKAILTVAWHIVRDVEPPATAFIDEFASSFTKADFATIEGAASGMVFRSNLISQDAVGPALISRSATPTTMVSHMLISRG